MKKKIIGSLLCTTLALGNIALTNPILANDTPNNSINDEVTSNINIEENLVLQIPFQTYEEFVKNLTFEKVDKLPDGAVYSNSLRDFYNELYGLDVPSLLASNKQANKRLGDLRATFYAEISNDNKILSLNNISSSIPSWLLGAEWVQENYTYNFSDRNHVVSGNIYGRINKHILTPAGFIRVGTDSYRVPYSVSSSEFH